MSKFAERLKSLRMSRNMSQLDLAQILGLTQSGVGLYETGKREPTLDRLEQLANLFNVSIDYLVGRTSDPYKTYSPMTRDFLDLLHLPDDQIVEMRAAEIDGKPVTKEQFKQFIAMVRAQRQLEEEQERVERILRMRERPTDSD